MAGKFELYKDAGGQYRFRLKAGNGEKILASEAYTSKASAENGIQSVRDNAPAGDRYERKEASNGQYMFNLRAGNNQVIGTSELYTSVHGRENGINSVMTNAPGAPVDDQT